MRFSRLGVSQRALLAGRFSRALLALLLVCGVTIGQYSSANAVSQEQSTPCWHRLSLFYHQFNPNVARATIYTSGSNYCSWTESKVTASFFGGYLDGYSGCYSGSQYGSLQIADAYGNPYRASAFGDYCDFTFQIYY